MVGVNQMFHSVREPVLDPAPEEPGVPDAEPQFLTARSAAARLGVSERTIRRAIARGEVRATKLAGSFRITPADLDRYETIRSRSRRATCTG